MKLVIHTQIRENYAAHNGFTGDYRWKCKGGNTYIVEDLNNNQVEKIKENGIPNISSLITERGDDYEEYVIGFSIQPDEAQVNEPWETPVVLKWVMDRWIAFKEVWNDEYHYMRKEILAKREEWIPVEGGQRGHYKMEYLTEAGWMSYEMTRDYLEEMA